jgi:predicted transcriptional regulator of viral defense system
MPPLLEKQKPTSLQDLLREAMVRSPTGHFCHLTSAYYHGLTNQVPNRIYIRTSKVGAARRSRPARLNDLQISAQFVKPHRRTEKIASFGDGRIYLISGSRLDQVGVVTVAPHIQTFPGDSRITGLERCLIDAVVAPHYNGGIVSVPEYFENAAEALDVEKLIDQYRQLDFLYPFHQSLGFFLEHTGQTGAAARLRECLPPTNRFFVDRAAKSSWPYDAKWRVHYPQGLVNGGL